MKNTYIKVEDFLHDELKRNRLWMNNMPDGSVETHAKLYGQKEPMGMDTCNNKTNNGLRAEETIDQGKQMQDS